MQEVVAERNPSAPAFRRGRMPPATPFAAPPAAAAAEPDNPYSMFLGGGAAAAPSAQLSKLPSLQYGALADEVGMGSRNWFKLQKAKVSAHSDANVCPAPPAWPLPGGFLALGGSCPGLPSCQLYTAAAVLLHALARFPSPFASAGLQDLLQCRPS